MSADRVDIDQHARDIVSNHSADDVANTVRFIVFGEFAEGKVAPTDAARFDIVLAVLAEAGVVAGDDQQAFDAKMKAYFSSHPPAPAVISELKKFGPSVDLAAELGSKLSAVRRI